MPFENPNWSRMFYSLAEKKALAEVYRRSECDHYLATKMDKPIYYDGEWRELCNRCGEIHYPYGYWTSLSNLL